MKQSNKIKYSIQTDEIFLDYTNYIDTIDIDKNMYKLVYVESKLNELNNKYETKIIFNKRNKR